MGDQHSQDFGSVTEIFFTFFVLYNYIIPISLYVTMEMQKFLGTLFFEWDLDMYDDVTGEAAICNTSDLNEELGQVEYLFTDKTGTLTENNMQFRRCSVSGVCYLEQGGKLYELGESGSESELGEPVDLTDCDESMENFLLCLALCHTVQVVSSDSPPSSHEDKTSLQYTATSPDEKALVEAMAGLNIVFADDEDEIIALEILGQSKLYRKLEILEFTSDRKRMSVIVQDEAGDIKLFSKGAESAVLPLVTDGPAQETLDHVADFAKRGLRTLVVGVKSLTLAQYEQMSIQMQKARQTLSSDRDTLVASTYEKVEKGLTVLGATGVEDELQAGVKETLESLRAAGIKVWILTGDKVETAENISVSCGHLKPGATKLYLTNLKTPEDLTKELTKHKSEVTKDSLGNYGLIVDGGSLKLALDFEKEMFKEVCVNCTAVVCCRMSPLQKCQVVNLIKSQKPSPVTAAVGDGANDVSMIQEAHVGLGIMGKEGRQAVRCSDFAFAKFRFLRSALLVHGHWYYLRVATLVQYFFYKNIAFITPQFYFLFYNGFSTQPLYDSFYLTCFNIFFTSLPILAYGLVEQDYSADTLLKHPVLYSINANNALMTWSHFLKWFFLGCWHSLAVYFVPTLCYLNNTASLRDGRDNYLETYGTLIFHTSVIVVNLKLLLHSRFWSKIFLGTIFLSLALLLLMSAIYALIFVVDFTSATYWSYIHLIGSPDYWLMVIIVSAICVLPDIIIDTIINTLSNQRLPIPTFFSRSNPSKTNKSNGFDTKF